MLYSHSTGGTREPVNTGSTDVHNLGWGGNTGFTVCMMCSYIISSVPSCHAGSTPLGMYRKLIEFHQAGHLSFQYVKTFNMDEYVNLPRDHKESYHTFMWQNFFKHIDIDPHNANILDGNASDLVKECDEYEEKIKEAGGIDLFIGGGRQLHILT